MLRASASLTSTNALHRQQCRQPAALLHQPHLKSIGSVPQRRSVACPAADSSPAEAVSRKQAEKQAEEPKEGAAPKQQQRQSGRDFASLFDELKEGFGSKGEGYLFAQLAAMALVVFCPFEFEGLFHACAALMMASGFACMYLGQDNLGENLSPMPQPREKHELVKTGIYSYIRHPMYSGVLLIAFGLADLTHSETRLALAVVLWVILEKKVAEEEKFLCERYPDYPEYKKQVKKFLPFLY